ncbi:MAG: hypothetical protein ABG776_02990, partial [Cyanobacteria bacterium J06555_13]
MDSGTINPPEGLKSELLVQFMDELRAAGYNIGINQYIAVQDLLLTLTTQGELHALQNLKPFMGPIVCSSATEQADFQHRFDQWAEQVRQLHYRPPLTNEQQAQVLEEELDNLQKSAKGLRRWLVATVTVFTVVLFPIPTLRDESPILDVTVPPSTTPEAIQDTSEPPPSTTPETSEPSPSITLETIPDTSTLIAPSPPDSILENHGPQLNGFLYLLVISSALLIWRFWWNWRARLFLNRRESKQSPNLQKILMQGLKAAVFPPNLIFKTAQQLRQRTRQQANTLDINLTIQASLKKGGWFTPVYGYRQVIPEYLFLIDRASYADHQAKFIEDLTQQLQQNGVYITLYFFDGDAQICYPEVEASLPQPLQVLANQYGKDRLVVIADAETFYSRLTGESEPWLEKLKIWEQRAILTPKPLASWGQWEFRLANQFIVLPLSRHGIVALSQVFRHGSATYRFTDTPPAPFPEMLSTRPRRWLERHPPDPIEGKQMLAELTAYLGETGLYWFSACAVFPELHWNITVYLGNVLKNHEGCSLSA